MKDINKNKQSGPTSEDQKLLDKFYLNK
jgi:hypothetical protein